MRRRTANIAGLKSERDSLRFEISQVERDIRDIQEQLDDSEYAHNPDRRPESDWWYRAKSALGHKERERQVLNARAQRLERKIKRHKPDAEKEQAKDALRGVLKALFLVARHAARYYETADDADADSLADALDHLDEVVPGWEEPQAPKEKASLVKIRLKPGG